MLVLSRKANQSLVIGESITVHVVEIGDDFVRLAIESQHDRELRNRYPQAFDLQQIEPERSVIITLSLHQGAILDRLRRRMRDDESPPPSRDEALGAILETIAESDEFPLPRTIVPRKHGSSASTRGG